jgi:hypothetical protein
MKLTVAELIEELKKENQKATVIFGSGNLTLYRLKDRTGELQFEFNELYEITD